jgi:hypothetical protein
MKEFNLELVRQGKKVTTRSGHEVRIICTDFKSKGNTPILALLKEEENKEEIIYFYTLKGKVYDDKESAFDLFMDEDDEWVNIYEENRRCFISESPYLTQKEAIDHRTSLRNCIATINLKEFKNE